MVLDAWMFPLDDSVYGNVEQPVLFLNSESFHWKENVKKIKKLIGNGNLNADSFRIYGIS